jgi:TRAP transporter TAXI family solute receptor
MKMGNLPKLPVRIATGIIVTMGGAAVFAGGAGADTFIMAADRAGTLYNASSSGVAKVLTTHSKHRFIVRAFGGPDAFIHDLNSGKYLLTVQSSNTSWFNYHGRTSSKRTAKDLRILRSGAGALRLSFVVYDDSDIKSVADLKGKRVTSDFGGHAAINPIVTATLGNAGLTWKDVRPVPVTGALESPRALGADRVDAAWASLGMPVVREIHAKKKVRYVPIENSPKSLAYLRENVFPGLRLVTMPPIKRLGLSAPTTLISSDSYILTHKNADPAIVQEIMDVLWNNTEEMQKAHFSLRGFTHETAGTDLPMVPYHPAAIAFLKSKGAWSDKAEAANAKLMQ